MHGVIEWLQEQQQQVAAAFGAAMNAETPLHAAPSAAAAPTQRRSSGAALQQQRRDAAAPTAAATLAGGHHPGEGLGFLTRLSGVGKHHQQQHPHTQQQQQQQRKRKQHDRGERASAEQQQQQQQQRAQAAVHPAGVAVVSGLSVYYGVKGLLKGYQTLRHRSLRHLIVTVAPALDALGCRYWLDFGSLLGAHRERDVIPYDNDADVCVLNPDWPALLPALRAALPGMRVFMVAPSEDRSVRWLRVVHGVGVMDLYGAYYDGDKEGGGDAAAGVDGAAAGDGGDCCSGNAGAAAAAATGMVRAADVDAGCVFSVCMAPSPLISTLNHALNTAKQQHEQH